MIADTLDGALEWMEERILEAAGSKKKREENLLKINDFEILRGFDEPTLSRLAACMEEFSLAAGEQAVLSGSEGDELFLIRRGSVRILLPLDGGKRHHLATIGRGDFFGEVAFLDHGRRSADVEAKVAADFYVLSRSRFNEQSRSDPVLGAQIFARLASAIAERLRQANTELQALEER